eukprot:scaffold235889_cov14-Tisochrysis_lutea.AAC.1
MIHLPRLCGMTLDLGSSLGLIGDALHFQALGSLAEALDGFQTLNASAFELKVKAGDLRVAYGPMLN